MEVWEKVTILFWFLIAFLICIESSKLEIGGFSHPGAGFLPLLLGLALALLSILLYVKNGIEKKNPERGEKTLGGLGNWKRVFWAVGALVFYGLFLNLLGFLLATFLTMFFLYLKMGDRRLRFALSASVVTTLSCYLVFQLWLSANLPKGVLGF